MFQSAGKFFGALLLLAVVGLVVAGCAWADALTGAPPPPPTNRAAPAAAPATLNVPALVPPTASAGQTDLTVFAAASLTDAFKEIAAQFEAAHPGVKVIYNFGGSNILRAQLEQGARADVFASANGVEMETARKAGLVGEDAQIFVSNRLVVITPSDNPAQLASLEDLAQDGLKLVIAEKNVPVGNYTLQMFEKMSADPQYGAEFGAAVLKNIVSQENSVRAVVGKVSLGEADAGVVYVSDITPEVLPRVKTFTVPDEFNELARYPIAPLREAAQPELARQFIEYVFAKDGGQAILGKWNFITIAP